MLTCTVELIRAFLGPKKLFKTNFFEKKGYLLGDKRFLSSFSRIIECNEAQRVVYTGPQAFLTITVEAIRAFL